MSIIAGLNIAAVQRLQQTWAVFILFYLLLLIYLIDF